MNTFFQLILRFTNDNSEKQDSYEIYNEAKEAKLFDYMKRPEEDQDFPKVRDYNDDVDELGLFSGSKQSSVHSQANENLSNSSENDNSTSSAFKDEQVKYVEVILPITRRLYKKITNLPHDNSSNLDIEEIYEVIMSNLFTVLDNRQIIILQILSQLQHEHDLSDWLYTHHCEKIYDQLTTIKNFKMNRNEFSRLCCSNDVFNEISQLFNKLNRLNTDKLVQNRIFRIHSHMLHWHNSFLTFVYEVKKNITLVLRDSNKNHAYAPSISSQCCSSMEFFIDLYELNVSYMVRQLNINYHFLKTNDQILYQKFNFNNARGSKIILLIDLSQVTLDNEMAESCKIINQVLSNKFVCGAYISKLILFVSHITSALDFRKIKEKACSIDFYYCAFQVLQSLPAGPTEITLKKMKIPETTVFGESLTSLCCDKVVIQRDSKLVIDKKCKNVKLLDVDGEVEYTGYCTFQCVHESRFELEIFTENNNSRVLIKDITFRSDFNCNDNVKEICIGNVMVQLPFTITFSGNCRNFVIENSKANIHITKVENVTIRNCNELFTGKFRLELPLHLNELSIQETMFEHCWTVSNQIDNLKMCEIVFANNSVFTLIHECKSIILSQYSGNFNFFGKMSLSEIQNNLYNSEFKVDLDNGNIINLEAIAILLEIDSSLLCKVKHFNLNFVQLRNIISLILTDDIDQFEVLLFYGAIRLSGIIQGKIMTFGFEGNMRVAKLDNKPISDVKIKNWTVLGKLTINCLAQSLDLRELSTNNPTNELLILKRYNNLFINNVASLITTKFCPYFNNICLNRACFAYNDKEHRFTIVGIFIFDIYQLPPGIKTIIIRQCNINVGSLFYLNSEFNYLFIKQSSGAFHLRNKFNIDTITLTQESVVEIKEENELSAEIRFEHLTFGKSLIIGENVKTLTLIDVKFVDNSIVQIFSSDVQTNIKSSCEIHWYESDKLSRIEKYGEDGVVCYINDEN